MQYCCKLDQHVDTKNKRTSFSGLVIRSMMGRTSRHGRSPIDSMPALKRAAARCAILVSVSTPMVGFCVADRLEFR